MSDIKNIQCPHCGEHFDVEAALAKHVEDKFTKKLKAEKAALATQLKEEKDKLRIEQEAFEEKKKRENDIFKEKLSEALVKKEGEIQKKLSEDFQVKIGAQTKELEERRKQVIELKEKELEMEKLKSKMTEQKKDLELQFQKDMRAQIAEKEEIISKRIQEESELKLKEKEQQLEVQKKLIEEMKRKADQGSMQSQGEIQELVIEEILRAKFPFDIIEEVPKGVRGADSVQTVINSAQQICGKIIIESKRTKAFSNDWLEKLKIDQGNIGAQIAVLITETMPKEMDKFGELNGVWVCPYSDFAALISVLRQVLIKTQSYASAQENKGDKKEVLYNFVISEEFKNQIRAIVEGFSGMKSELDREKRAMQSIWKRREKQIDLVIDNTINMHSSIKGIAGNAIPTMEILELGDPNDLSLDTEG